MPIRLATIGRQRTVAGIAKTMFDLSSAASLEEAQAALIRANPHLADEGAIRPGERIIVPPIRELRPAAPSDDETPPDPVFDLARERFAALEKLAGDPLERVIADAKQAAKEAGSREKIDAILKVRPDLREQLDTIQQGAKAQVEHVAASADALREAIGRLRDDLAGATPR